MSHTKNRDDQEVHCVQGAAALMAKTRKQSRGRMIEVEKAEPAGHTGHGKEFRFIIVSK